MNLCVLCFSVFVLKVMGFLIVKFVVKLVFGYCFDEILNDIIGVIFVSFEFMFDYVVVKVLCFVFEKFLVVDVMLIMIMKLVGEVMVIGCNYVMVLQKVFCLLEKCGLSFYWGLEECFVEELFEIVKILMDGWIVMLQQVLCKGVIVEQVFDVMVMDFWFFDQIVLINEVVEIVCIVLELDVVILCYVKEYGFLDVQLVQLCGEIEVEVCGVWYVFGVCLVYKMVDICVGEFLVFMFYYYFSYDVEIEVVLLECIKVVIIGLGLNCIGQGVEFDYLCVYVLFVLFDVGFEIVMVNCNLEMVLIDYDMFDCLYFELLMFEDVLEVFDVEVVSGMIFGVVCQFGGQILFGFVKGIEVVGYMVLGMSLEVIDFVEECEFFLWLFDDVGLFVLCNGIVIDVEGVVCIVEEIGYLVLVWLSFVFGGCGMEIVYDIVLLCDYFVCIVGEVVIEEGKFFLVDCFLDDVIEFDVDVFYDGIDLFIGGVMEYFEEVGIYLGDFSCILLLVLFGCIDVDCVCEVILVIVEGVGVCGLLNVQFVISVGVLYVIEVNLCVSCMVFFVLKVFGILMVKVVSCVMMGLMIVELWVEGMLLEQDGFCVLLDVLVLVKEVVFLFKCFCIVDGKIVDLVFGLEMCLIGEVMGIDCDFLMVFVKSQVVVYGGMLMLGIVFILVVDFDKWVVILLVY